MTVSFIVDIATESPAAELAGRLPLDPGHEAELLRGLRTSAGVLVQVRDTEPPSWSPIKADLGIDATVSVEFQLSKADDVDPQLDAIARLALALLARTPGDAVLHRDFERVLLLRRGDELQVDDTDTLWSDARLALVAGPYRRTALTFS